MLHYYHHLFCVEIFPLKKDQHQRVTVFSKSLFSIAACPKILVPNKDFLNGMTKQRQSSCKKTSTKIIKNKKTALEFVTISTSCANSIRRIDHYLMKRRGENTYIFSYLNEVLDGKKYTTNSDIFKKMEQFAQQHRNKRNKRQKAELFPVENRSLFSNGFVKFLIR